MGAIEMQLHSRWCKFGLRIDVLFVCAVHLKLLVYPEAERMRGGAETRRKRKVTERNAPGEF